MNDVRCSSVSCLQAGRRGEELWIAYAEMKSFLQRGVVWDGMRPCDEREGERRDDEIQIYVTVMTLSIDISRPHFDRVILDQSHQMASLLKVLFPGRSSLLTQVSSL